MKKASIAVLLTLLLFTNTLKSTFGNCAFITFKNSPNRLMKPKNTSFFPPYCLFDSNNWLKFVAVKTSRQKSNHGSPGQS